MSSRAKNRETNVTCANGHVRRWAVPYDFKCKKCPARFFTRQELANYTIKVKHSDTVVICPWCPEPIEREYLYPQDLSRHVKSNHAAIISAMPAKTLTNTNIFFFARDPSAYAAAHNIKPSLDTEEA